MLTKSFSIKGGSITTKMDICLPSLPSIEVFLDNPIFREEVRDVKETRPTIAGGQILEEAAGLPKPFCCGSIAFRPFRRRKQSTNHNMRFRDTFSLLKDFLKVSSNYSRLLWILTPTVVGSKD